MNKVLLTGATGFIGRHCVPLLCARGYEVHAVSSRPLEDAKSFQEALPPDAQVYWHSVDLMHVESAALLIDTVQPTHLLHLAWTYTVPGQFWNTTENFGWVQSSLELLQAFASCRGRRVVFAGTCAEYDWSYGYCSEHSTPLRPNHLYGTCKHALQVMMNAWAERAGISAAWARLFFLYGPHEYPPRLVSSTILSLLNGETARCTHGRQTRDFMHVADAAAGIVALLDSEVTGPVNVASGVPATVREIVQQIGDLLGSRERIALGALPAAPDDPRFIVADVERLQHEVGWNARYDLQAGLQDTIEWWRYSVRRENTH